MDLQPEVVGIYYLPTIAYKVSTEKNLIFGTIC
jgi:hypothetical protein